MSTNIDVWACEDAHISIEETLRNMVEASGTSKLRGERKRKLSTHSSHEWCAEDSSKTTRHGAHMCHSLRFLDVRLLNVSDRIFVQHSTAQHTAQFLVKGCGRCHPKKDNARRAWESPMTCVRARVLSTRKITQCQNDTILPNFFAYKRRVPKALDGKVV